jgi:hypothetical protein
MKTTPRVIAITTALLLSSQMMVADPGNGKGKGKGKGNSPDFVPPGLVEKGGVPPGQRRAPVEIVVKQAPPTVRVEVVPARPSPKHIWVPGFWTWETTAYAWTPGIWMLPPEPAAVWVAPRFESRSGVSVFISGYWKL